MGIELPKDFEDKLKFRKLDEQMVYVGLQVPEVASIPSNDVKDHIIVLFFKWLRNRGVKQILKVVIRDNHLSPCGDEIIELALKDLNVQYLYWDRPDLSSRTVHTACPNIRELSLYSTGTSTVIHGWEDEKGLRAFEKVFQPESPGRIGFIG